MQATEQTPGTVQLSQASRLSDEWMASGKGPHRAFFDFPSHRQGLPLLHIYNYFSNYRIALGIGSEPVCAFGTFYGIGPQSSISMAFNDAMWAKLRLGAYTGLKDAAGQLYTRNVFNRPRRDDLHLLMQAMRVPVLPMFTEVMPSIGIEELQKMGTTFLLCSNALSGWCAELAANNMGEAAALEDELRANVLPGVIIVPAMVMAIDQALRAGMTYKRQ